MLKNHRNISETYNMFHISKEPVKMASSQQYVDLKNFKRKLIDLFNEKILLNLKIIILITMFLTFYIRPNRNQFVDNPFIQQLILQN